MGMLWGSVGEGVCIGSWFSYTAFRGEEYTGGGESKGVSARMPRVFAVGDTT